MILLYNGQFTTDWIWLDLNNNDKGYDGFMIYGILLLQGAAGHLGSPEQGKGPKYFLKKKGIFPAQNRAAKTR